MLEHYVWKIFHTKTSFIGFILLYYLPHPFRVPSPYFCFRVQMSLGDAASDKRGKGGGKGERERERETELFTRT
jgi:hypothetical protein